jgi:hypothetical protein
LWHATFSSRATRLVILRKGLQVEGNYPTIFN